MSNRVRSSEKRNGVRRWSQGPSVVQHRECDGGSSVLDTARESRTSCGCWHTRGVDTREVIWGVPHESRTTSGICDISL